MDLWNFAVKTYGQDNISEDCLALQDTFNVDISQLLWAAWAAANGHVVDNAALAEAEILIATWRKEIIKPLRNLRRQLKHGPRPAPSNTSNALRNKIKEAELMSEKIELETLASLSLRPAIEGHETLLNTLRLTVRHFSKQELSSQNEAALARIATATQKVLQAPNLTN